MKLGMSVVYSSFPRKRESRDPRTKAVPPVHARGKLWTPAFAGVMVTHCKHGRHFRSDAKAGGARGVGPGDISDGLGEMEPAGRTLHLGPRGVIDAACHPELLGEGDEPDQHVQGGGIARVA